MQISSFTDEKLVRCQRCNLEELFMKIQGKRFIFFYKDNVLDTNN